MKENNTHIQAEDTQGLAKALTMYVETVSPSRDMLVNVLNQIPEIKEFKANDRRAIRSPYIWTRVAQFVSVCAIALALYPSFFQSPTPSDTYSDNPFYAIDSQVEEFEAGINEEDYQAMLVDYTL
jgi:hypothetical protein